MKRIITIALLIFTLATLTPAQIKEPPVKRCAAACKLRRALLWPPKAALGGFLRLFVRGDGEEYGSLQTGRKPKRFNLPPIQKE